MKLGLFTAAFPNWSLEQCAGWASENGFEAIEIACWPHEQANRRYAGVTHIDVETLDAGRGQRRFSTCWRPGAWSSHRWAIIPTRSTPIPSTAPG